MPVGLEAACSPDTNPALAVTCVPAFDDNYLWLIHGRGDAARRVVAVDPGDAAAIVAALDRDRLSLAAIFVTHHHADHVGGVAELHARYRVPVFGPAREEIPARSTALRGGDRVDLPELGLGFDVLDVPGHTAGHIAYYGHGAVFCGDTLFSGGCGRLFEGTAEQMLASLDRLARLPSVTRVYCAHEYTLSNLRFATAVDPGNSALGNYMRMATELRARNEPTVPSTLGLELAVNPFLRTRETAVREAAARHAGRPLAGDVDAFAVVRAWKNGFRG